MPRQSDNILNILTTLPWWVSVVTASFVYVAMAFLLPALAGDNIFASGLAQATPPLAPYGFLLFLMPTPISLFNSWRKRKQLDVQQGITSIRDLSWQHFEQLVGEAYRRQGFHVVENDSAGPDGGIDLVIRKSGKSYLVQCKQYRSQKVGVKVVREMFGLVAAEQAAGGIIVTSGKFNPGGR
jgi:restriction system protein